ncbi:hypothetical protein C7U61_00825 [Rhizobium sp. JAB6]|jgi:hypothetical protein|uniref:hypothetical protein n=1 Tax=Rhizobium sp. JAB6 TaxID=2127050 RepID=UPI000D13B319|nr:hypothetical protein [Rhizobium sp. JAB6]PST23116.1 hypothetical protein C7U61_00825 [Rhizobium sp. JAB6]
MLTNYLFKDLYDDRWGDPRNPDAVEPSLPKDKGGVGRKGLLGLLAKIFRRRRKHPSAWSFTIPSEVPDAEVKAEVRQRNGLEDPKFLAIAKALSRNC